MNPAEFPAPRPDALLRIADALAEHGYIVMPEFLPHEVLQGLYAYSQSLDADSFSRAGIGRETGHQLNREVRSDRIHWIDGDDSDDGAVLVYRQWMEALRLSLNRDLYLGLFDYESHFAWYPQGTFYKKHRDAFKGQRNRVLTTVLYLNPHWNSGDGGELVLYRADDSGELLRVEPCFGTLVVFLSEEFPHEVLPVQRPRFSIAGWFRLNGGVLSTHG